LYVGNNGLFWIYSSSLYFIWFTIFLFLDNSFCLFLMIEISLEINVLKLSIFFRRSSYSFSALSDYRTDLDIYFMSVWKSIFSFT
jgi:hypothetical protein